MAAIAAVLQLRHLRLAKQLQCYLEVRIVALGVHSQLVSRLLNRGILDDALFMTYYDTAPRPWKRLQPVAAVMRERTNSPLWIDIEYQVHRNEKKGLLQKFLGRYPPDFARRAGLANITQAGTEGKLKW